jgi:hypothetical protein
VSALLDKRDRARAAALDRLAKSRLRLRHQLIHEDPHRPGLLGGSLNIPRRLRALWRTMRRSLRGSPVAAVALTAVQDWWQRHPWRTTGELVAEELNASLSPVVKRHPLATMLISGAVGLVIFTAKPWRWPSVRRQLQPLPGRVTRWMFHQLGQAPGQALLSGLLIMLARHKPDPPSPPSPPPGPPSPATPASPEAQT